MIGKIIEFILSLFRRKSKKQSELEKIVEEHEKKLKEIKDEKHDIDSVADYFRD